MEYIEVRIPVTIANDLATCIDVGVEGADHLPDSDAEQISIIAGDIRIAAQQRIESITATFRKLMGKE